MRVVGVSFDPPEALSAWAHDQGFPYELWSDTQATLAQHYGAADSPEDGHCRRVTRLLDAQGFVVLEYAVGLNIPAHPADVLEDARTLFGRGASTP